MENKSLALLKEGLRELVVDYENIDFKSLASEDEIEEIRYHSRLAIDELILGTLNASLKTDLPLEELERLRCEIDLIERLYRTFDYNLSIRRLEQTKPQDSYEKGLPPLPWQKTQE